MVAPRFDQFGGRLSASQIAAGMNAAEDNAARLLADAQLLLNAGRYPTAASVAILCIEEAAKVSILRRTARGLERVSITSQQEPPRDHSGTLCPGWPPSG